MSSEPLAEVRKKPAKDIVALLKDGNKLVDIATEPPICGSITCNCDRCLLFRLRAAYYLGQAASHIPVPAVDSRERFEAWAETVNIPGVRSLSVRRMPTNPELYSTRDTRIAWEIWQAKDRTSVAGKPGEK